MNDKMRIAVVGLGDVFSRFYYRDEVLRKIANKYNCEVYCLDITDKWKDKLESEPSFKFVNVSIPIDFETLLQSKKFDLIIIATEDNTHIEVALKWITAEFGRMLVEKPLSNKPQEIDKLLEHPRYTNENDIPLVLTFSHYRAKIHEHFKNKKTLGQILGKDFGQIVKFRFFCLEDYSGTDLNYLDKLKKQEKLYGNDISPDINGPIEIPNRQKALNKGMVYDLGSHMLSILHYLGSPETVDINTIWAGQYVGLNGDYDQKTKIEKETFASISFTFTDDFGNLIEGQGYLGKGIRGIDTPENFGLFLENPELGEVKLIELEGEFGKKVQIFFTRCRTTDQDNLIRVISDGKLISEKMFPIEKSPYYYIFENALLEKLAANDDDDDESLFFDASVAQVFLNKIKEISDKIDEGVEGHGGEFPKYKLGKRLQNGEIIPCESLDEIMERFDPIWEKP